MEAAEKKLTCEVEPEAMKKPPVPSGTHLHQDPEQLFPDPEGWQRLVWERTDPLFDGRHHATVDEGLL